MKKIASVLLAALLLCLAVSGLTETFTGTVKSNIGAGDVSVTITVEDGKVTAAEVAGDTETRPHPHRGRHLRQDAR